MKENLHQSKNPQIDIATCWENPEFQIIDVRSPNEFIGGAIPNAVNLPLLDDMERETIGTIYRQCGQQEAIGEGYRILDAKLVEINEQFRKFSNKDKFAVCCARGGMRSRVITSLMISMGYSAKQLTGGYKAFRNWNLEQLEQFQFNNLIVLHGQTGVGKTLVLTRLPNFIDLEGLANHRGSMFGAIGKRPVSQKTFDASLLLALKAIDNSRPVFVEGESRKIGKVFIPNRIFSQMKQARNFLLKAPINIRAKRTVDEYIRQQPETAHKTRNVIGFLKKELGKPEVTELLALFDRKNYELCFQKILEAYYDKKYKHSMKNLSIEKEIVVEEIESAVSEINRFAISNSI